MKDLNKLSFEDLKKEIEALEQKKEIVTTKPVGVWQVGKNYVLRTVTMIDLGKLVEVTENELVLESASWIPDTGRLANFLAEGKLNEVEPFPEGKVIVGRNALIDAIVWKHKLPKNQK